LLLLLLAASLTTPALGDWEELEPVPDDFKVGAGAAITYGDGKIWGLFPTPDSEETYIAYYVLTQGRWYLPDSPCVATEILENTAITWQWLEGGVLFIAGIEGDDYDMLYWHVQSSGAWNEVEIEDFNLGPGASIAYRPNPDLAPLYPIPGWLYCLAGGSREFWRYTIPTALEDQTVDGIHPGEGAVIADKTPNFIWPEVSGASQYRLLVAGNVNFGACQVDIYTAATSYQATSALGNGDHYWKVGAWSDLGGWTWSDVHSFELQAGWTRLADIPTTVNDGGALVYAKRPEFGERLYAFVGGDTTCFYRYGISAGSWQADLSSGRQRTGSALATHSTDIRIYALLGEHSERHWHYRVTYPFGWRSGVSLLPDSLGPGASLAFDPVGRCLYLIVGEDSNGNPRNDFYRIAAPGDYDEDGEGGGGQARSSRPTAGWARLVPAAGTVTVEYSLDAPAEVKATVTDAAGRVVATLCAGRQPRGAHRVTWNAEVAGYRVSAGVYFVLIDAGTAQARFKVVVR